MALLALEGFLLLAQWFQWFAFNRHAIWSILIAASAIAATMLLMFFWFLLSLLFKWRFQFSILALLLLTLVVAIACSWFVVARERAAGNSGRQSKGSRRAILAFVMTMNAIRMAV